VRRQEETRLEILPRQYASACSPLPPPSYYQRASATLPLSQYAYAWQRHAPTHAVAPILSRHATEPPSLRCQNRSVSAAPFQQRNVANAMPRRTAGSHASHSVFKEKRQVEHEIEKHTEAVYTRQRGIEPRDAAPGGTQKSRRSSRRLAPHAAAPWRGAAAADSSEPGSPAFFRSARRPARRQRVFRPARLPFRSRLMLLDLHARHLMSVQNQRVTRVSTPAQRRQQRAAQVCPAENPTPACSPAGGVQCSHTCGEGSASAQCHERQRPQRHPQAVPVPPPRRQASVRLTLEDRAKE